jgi:chromosome segregation ATPase
VVVIKAILAFIDGVPGIVWAAIVAALLFMVVSMTMGNAKVKNDLRDAQTEHAKTKSEYSQYQADVEKKQRLAEAKQREIELSNFRNAEKVAYESAKREAALADDLARSRSREQRLRDEISSFRAATARDAASGNTAALAAKANTATELYESCGTEYRSMAEEAERVRIQAIGLLDYIRGNSMCSSRFGQGVPEPAK